MAKKETEGQPRPRGSRAQWNNKNLRILTDFMNRYGLTTVDLGKASGKNRMTYTAILNKDDALLSLMEHLFSSFGCRLVIDVEHPDDVLDIQVPNLVINNKKIENKRLGFVTAELVRKGWWIKDLADAMGEKSINLNKHLSSDNCKMSYLYRIADAMGVTLRFRLLPLEENKG